MTQIELKEQLKSRYLPVGGKKAAQQERLTQFCDEIRGFLEECGIPYGLPQGSDT